MMAHARVIGSASLLCGLLLGTSAWTQVPTPGGFHQPPPGTTAASLTQLKRWFELEAPFSRPLKVSFDVRPAPTFELLQPPTFEGRATLWHRGNLSVSLFERVAPALALDCTTTCTPTYEKALGAETRLELGALNRQVPSLYLSFRQEVVQQFPVTPRFARRTLFGLGGLLDL